ncbi:PE family protein [Mycobacterium simiae]|uniref:PE family protein n=1 Tax=Mycobacterium simiae TaxID=1784 RepID=A0A5B1BTM5_MYCSI|nr:PE family protein [Mycobacterium simiae]KAA1251312.1 PE family protein [Mycobacterium simiae]
MTLRVVSEGSAAASVAAEALPTRFAAAHGVAAQLISAVVPPEVVGFSARGDQHTAVTAQGAEGLCRLGVGVVESGESYAAGDAAAASAFVNPGGLA